MAGGAGFIGTHTVIELVAAGYTVTIFDNLSNSKCVLDVACTRLSVRRCGARVCAVQTMGVVWFLPCTPPPPKAALCRPNSGFTTHGWKGWPQVARAVLDVPRSRVTVWLLLLLLGGGVGRAGKRPFTARAACPASPTALSS